MSEGDALDSALEAIHRAQAEAELEEERRRSAAEEHEGEREEAQARLAEELRRLGVSFAERARTLGVEPEEFQVVVGTRERDRGIWPFRRRVEENVLEPRRAWVVEDDLAPGHRKGLAGLFVQEDGEVTVHRWGGRVEVASIDLVYGVTRAIELVAEKLAAYLVDRGG